MKKLIQYLFFFCAILFIGGCKEKPTMFSETDGVYFGTPNTTDSVIAYSFAKYPKKVVDTIQVPVSIMGNSFGADRPLSVEVVSSPQLNAVQDVNFKLLNNYAVPANAFKTTIPVVVYRTPDLDNGTASFKLKLNQNEFFPGSGITAQQTIKVNVAYMQQPPTWGTFTGLLWAGYSANFGTWTKTKYKLILDALYNPETGTTVTEFPGQRTSPPIIYPQYLATVRNYIKTKYPGNYGGTGATLRDPDANNALIQVGPANY